MLIIPIIIIMMMMMMMMMMMVLRMTSIIMKPIHPIKYFKSVLTAKVDKIIFINPTVFEY